MDGKYVPRYECVNQMKNKGWKAFIIIKDMVKAKQDKSLCANLFISSIVLGILYTSKLWAMTKKTGYSTVS